MSLASLRQGHGGHETMEARPGQKVEDQGLTLLIGK